MHLNIEKERVWVKTKTYKRFAMATASVALVGSAIVPVASAAPYYGWISDYPFTDVPNWSTHYINVLEANELGVMTGYNDGTFKPNQKLNRGNVAKVLGKYVVSKSGMTLEEYVREHNINGVENFDDVPDDWADAELVVYSKIVKDAGIFEGSNNRLNASKLMPRDQIAEVLVRAFGFEDKGGTPNIYYDGETAYAKSIEIIIENGISNANHYRPFETTSRSQFASFMVRAVKVSEGLDTEEPYPFPIKSVSGLADITVNLGEMPKLPETVEVTLKSGLKSTAAVVWNTEDLNKDEVGSYILTGNFPGTDLTASIKVNVREPQYKRIKNISIDNNVIKIIYPQNMSKTTLDLSNYRFNGGPMPEGTSIYGEENYVTITLPSPEGPISADMEYTFEITQNVKTINSDIIVGNSFAANNGTEAPKNVMVTGVFHDNVGPALVSADYVIKAPGENTSHEIQLTFSEDISTIFNDTFYEDDGQRDWWEEFNTNLAERLTDMMSLKIGETEASVYIWGSWSNVINGNKVYVSIPETNIDQTSTLTIVPEEVKHNEEPVLTDDSLGKNPLAETFTKTITQDNVVVIP